MEYNTIYTQKCVRSYTDSGLRRVDILFLSVIYFGPKNHYGIDRILVCSGSGCTVLGFLKQFTSLLIEATELQFNLTNLIKTCTYEQKSQDSLDV